MPNSSFSVATMAEQWGAVFHTALAYRVSFLSHATPLLVLSIGRCTWLLHRLVDIDDVGAWHASFGSATRSARSPATPYMSILVATFSGNANP